MKMKMIMVMIIICFFVVLFMFINKNYFYSIDNYTDTRILSVINTNKFLYPQKRVANTPLTRLKSKLKDFKLGTKLPNIFVYKPKYLPKVREQGNCGSCWAFVVTSVLSDSITMRVFKFQKNLSVQQLISCYGDGKGCSGASPEDVFIWMEKTRFKLMFEDKFPYTQVGDVIETKCVTPQTGIMVAKNSVRSLCTYIDQENISNPTENISKILKDNIYKMKMELYKYGPFFGTITVYEDFLNFNGKGVYAKKEGTSKSSNVSQGGHAIVVIGWCDKDVDPRPEYREAHWICKNSWGENWARQSDFKGYFAIKMGVNECGIESRSGTAEPAIKPLAEDKIITKVVYTNIKEYLFDALKK